MELKPSSLRSKGFNVLPFNRTFMELKQQLRQAIEKLFGAFNRTFMELKLESICISSPLLYTFNRTFMELKPNKEAIAGIDADF